MEWLRAKEDTLAQWYRIRDGIGTDDALDLVIEVNAATGMCAKAKLEAGRESNWHKCDYCLAQQQFGGCAALDAALTEAIVSKDWERARRLAEEAVANLEQLAIPV